MKPVSYQDCIDLLKSRKQLLIHDIDLDKIRTYDKIIDALEKQMPVKPRENISWDDICNDEDFVDEHWLCRKCENYLDESEEYCRLCGQKIDWSIAHD